MYKFRLDLTVTPFGRVDRFRVDLDRDFPVGKVQEAYHVRD
jgi:hypothetical protein